MSDKSCKMEDKTKKELVTKLISSSSKINGMNDNNEEASYIKIPIENIELLAEELDVTFEEACDVLTEYFKPKE